MATLRFVWVGEDEILRKPKRYYVEHYVWNEAETDATPYHLGDYATKGQAVAARNRAHRRGQDAQVLERTNIRPDPYSASGWEWDSKGVD